MSVSFDQVCGYGITVLVALAHPVGGIAGVYERHDRRHGHNRDEQQSDQDDRQKPGKEEASAPTRRDAPALTPRQLEVLGLMAEGKSAREIGGELYLSQATVRNHIRALSQALGAHSQLEVLAKARWMDII